MSFMAEIAQPGDVIYISNEDGTVVRCWVVSSDASLKEITHKDPPKEPV